MMSKHVDRAYLPDVVGVSTKFGQVSRRAVTRRAKFCLIKLADSVR